MEVSDEESSTQEERMEEEIFVGGGRHSGSPPGNNLLLHPAMLSDRVSTSSSSTNLQTNPGGGETEIKQKMEDCVRESLDGFDPDQMKHAEGQLKRYLSWAVPYCYKLKRNLSPLDKSQPQDGNSSMAQSILFPILEGFLNRNNEYRDYMRSLDVARPSLCGKVFKVCEPTYSCRDCGMDPTCVLCSDCFKHSGHKNHRYRISTSSGGGYCDCGDEEAWKSDKYCSLHQPEIQEGSDDRSMKPKDLENRARFLFKLLLEYAYKLLTFELTLSVPADLEFGDDETCTLPENIRNFVEDDLYCTVLYNDETHTFDTVISTLQRALECAQRDAVDYATMIDREGRCVVKIDQFQQCYQAKQVIERYTSRNGAKPLRVIVMQSHVVAHQIFSLKVLDWMEGILEKSGAFRDLFADLVEKLTDESSPRSMLEGVMLNDTKLWKSARTTWHHVLIAGMLKDYELKKKFATLFSKNYADMMKDFISDDHDHPVSITSLSVQIFTVPTIAHFLIEHHDVIFTIMRTLMSECEQKLNSGMSMSFIQLITARFYSAPGDIIEERKLEFDRAGNGSMLKRTNFVVIDLKYILTIPPTIWTDGLIKNFNRGMDYFLQLLCTMQEMDAVTRQTGNHMEYEPEWESAFNLQIKLQPVLTLSLEWLATNKNIFIRAFRYCLRELAKEYNTQMGKTATKEFANHATTCYVYDVASESVSVHLPLTRFFAGLYVFLEQYGLEFVSAEFQVADKPVPEILIEPSLRTQVLLAQVHAGMWKRNGYSLLNQLYFYQNVRCRQDMMDKDIVALQIGASLIEANEFLIHVLNRFDLFQWADNTFYERYFANVEDDLYKHVSTILSEFLGLVINIFSARYVPGVGQVTKNDCIKKEIIQLLCIESMTHSSLSKGLVENVNGETGLEEVIEEIAIFKKSSNAGQGYVYELKPEQYQEYDWHHYHYTREEMSRAEEKQRERKKTAKEPEFFPPPTLPFFTGSFNLVVNLLKSDVLLQILSLVLQRSVRKTKTFNDSHLRKALHLIGHGLNEEIARNEKETEHFFQFCEACKRWKIFEYLDALLKEAHLAQHYDMILWIRKQKSKIRPRSESDIVMPMEEEVVVQPPEEEETRKRARLAAETRAKVLANMIAAQQKFMAVNADLFATDEEDVAIPDEKEAEPIHLKTVALGPNQTPFRQDDETYVCILCKEEHPLSINSKRFVLAAFIQRSSVLCETRDELRAKEIDKSFEFLEKPDIWMRRNLLLTPHVSSCGHIMHETCWASHIEGVINKERRRPYRHPQSFDVDKQEWLCPMCDCICNAALPMALPLHKLYPITESLTEEYVVSVLQPIVNYAEGKRKEEEMEVSQEQKVIPSAPNKTEECSGSSGSGSTPTAHSSTQSPTLSPPQSLGAQIVGVLKKHSSSSSVRDEEIVTVPATGLDLAARAKVCFPPRPGYTTVDIPEDTKQAYALSYRVWLRGMEIMDRFTHNNPYEYDSDDAAEVGEDKEIPDEGPFRNSIFTRKLIKRLYRRGFPAELLLQIFHGHIYSEHQETTNWLHAKFYDKMGTFMERVFSVARDKLKDDPDKIGYQLHRTLWHSLAYTIMSAEAYHRDQKLSFFGENVPIRKSMGLKFLTRVCSVSVDSQFFSTCWVLRSEVMLLFLVIWHGESQLPCMLELDAFGLLVFLTYLMPFALCHTYDVSIYSKNYKTTGTTASSSSASSSSASSTTQQQQQPQSGGDEEAAATTSSATPSTSTSLPSVPGRMSIQPPVGSALDHHNLRLVFTIHVYQIIVSMDNLAEFTEPHDEQCGCHLKSTSHTSLYTEEVEASKSGVQGKVDVLRQLLFYQWAKPRETLAEDNPTRRAFPMIKAHLDCDKLWEEVCKRAIPFLRCCAKFYESMTGISPPPSLEKVESSFDDLVSYLDLPKSLYELFDCAEIADLSIRWSRHPSMRTAVDPQMSELSNDPNLKYLSKLPLPRTLRPLINLPTDYTDLINSVSLFKCAKCDPHDSRMPTMCLICGEILCSQSYCCQQDLKKESMGACTYHAYFCGGGIGIFLRIRECRLFLLSGRNKGCHMLPPYLDEYGETDQGLRRGNPMTLSPEKYEYFRRLWIQHAIPEEIARITEHNNSLPTTEWLYL